MNNNNFTDACNSPEAEASHEQAMKLICDFWTMRIVETIGQNELRFGEISKTISTINPVTLTGRLKRLEEQGIVARKTETRDKQSVTYQLTAMGQDLLPIVESIKSFTIGHTT